MGMYSVGGIVPTCGTGDRASLPNVTCENRDRKGDNKVEGETGGVDVEIQLVLDTYDIARSCGSRTTLRKWNNDKYIL